MDKVSINAMRLLQLGEQLQSINNELKTLINAPEKAMKATEDDKLMAKYFRTKKQRNRKIPER